MPNRSQSQPEGQRSLNALRVLVVDDNANDRMLLADFLGQQGCRIYVASDGLDGFRKAQLVHPDLILMDVVMPVCDGLTACRQLKAAPATRDIPLIFLSASTRPSERVAGLAAGAIDYISKPFDFEEVRLRLRVHLGHHAIGAERTTDEAPLLDTATSLDASLFRSARAVLRANLGQTPDLATLAQAVGTNSRRLTLAFRRCMGVKVADYVREERLLEARRLLMDTALDVRTIAETVGYSSGANFATAFRERYGVSPSALRQSRKADPLSSSSS